MTCKEEGAAAKEIQLSFYQRMGPTEPRKAPIQILLHLSLHAKASRIMGFGHSRLGSPVSIVTPASTSTRCYLATARATEVMEH